MAEVEGTYSHGVTAQHRYVFMGTLFCVFRSGYYGCCNSIHLLEFMKLHTKKSILLLTWGIVDFLPPYSLCAQPHDPPSSHDWVHQNLSY